MDKYVGKRLEGRYEIQTLIGSGGMANVYKAYDIIDQRTVAVKILRDEYLGNTEFLRRFKNESKAIAVLSHPNIVRVLDVSFTGKVHSIVMEYIDGITLKDYIERQGSLDWKEAVHFTMEILKALQHAHDKGIVHRDIKPQNIMLLQSGTIKVTDFGIARFARSEVQTITDRAIGSVHYISPEQAMGEATDEKSDIYSVGVMLFEMLTGTLPFEADSAVSVAIKQIQTQAVRPTSINPSIPPGLEDITMRAMQKNAVNRYQSTGEMMADIERFKRDPDIHFAYKYLDVENDASQQKKYRRAISQAREDTMEAKRKRTPYIPILTGVTFAFVLASLGFIGLMISLNNPFKQVAEKALPDLTGVKFDTAIIQFQDFEIVMDGDPLPNDEYGAGYIFEQTPTAGREVKVDSTVRVKVSSGYQSTVLPDFAGRDASETAARLQEMGLEADTRSEYSSTVPAGSVIYTDPSRDAEVRSGAVVTVYVSMGPEEQLVNIRDVLGMTLDSAKTYLEMYSLKLGEVNHEDNDAPQGTIIAQEPEPGALRPSDSAINVMVSNGPGDGDDGEGSSDRVRSYHIPVPAPNINRTVIFKAWQDNELVAQEPIIPSEIVAWRPQFRGTTNTSEIHIYIDDTLYMVYKLDFSKGTYEPIEDHTADFQ